MFKKIKAFLFENTSNKQTVAKNTIWLSISNFGGRLIKAAIVIYAARALGTAEYGVFSYAVTLAGFMSLFMDPGINAVLMRDASRSSEEERVSIFSATIIIKTLLLLFGIGVIIFAGPYFSTLPGAKALLPAVAIILAFDTFREFFSSFIRAKEKMEWDAGIFIFTNIAIVAFGYLALRMSPTALALGWGYAIGTTLGAIAVIVVLQKQIREALSHFSRTRVLPILQSAWPFAIAGALGLLFTNSDILIISWMRTASDVGIYSAAIRIIQILYLIPGILQMSTLPLLSRLAKHDKQKFRLVLERTVSLLFMISIPLTIGGMILGTSIMSFIFGSAFVSGGLAFSILAASLVVDFSGAVIVNAIFAYEDQKSLIITAAVGGVSNILFDLLLIPRFGIAGSAAATLIAQTLDNSLLWYLMKRANHFEVFPYLKKISLASIVMAIVTGGSLLLHINLILNIILSTIVYVGVLKLLREPLLGDIRAIISSGV